MVRLIGERLFSTVILMLAVSVVAFILIQLPPGDYADSYVNKKAQGGVVFTMEEVDEMRHQLGLDRPLYVQYVDWIADFIAHMRDIGARNIEPHMRTKTPGWTGLATGAPLFDDCTLEARLRWLKQVRLAELK